MSIYHDQHQEPHEKPEGEIIHWRPSIYGILENEKGEWLMVQPSWTKRLDLPGGGVEPEETFAEGLAREFYEETGYRVQVKESLFVGENNFYHKFIKQFQHAIIILYRVELVDEKQDLHVVNTFEDGHEIDDIRWVDPKTLTEEDVQPPVWMYLKTLNV